MNGLMEGLKFAAKYIASASVSSVIGNMIGIKTPKDAPVLTKLSVALGTIIISGIASDMAMTYAEKSINEIADTIVQTNQTIAEAAKQLKERNKEGEG